MNKEITISDIQDKIINLPGRPPAMLAQDVAEIYESTSELVHQAVRRNPERFPEPDFCFRTTGSEFLRLQIDGANHQLSLAKTRTAPLMFTRLGANMLSAVLTSPVAVSRSIQIMRAFSAMEDAVETGANPYLKELSGVLQANFKQINDRISKIEDFGMENMRLKDDLLAAKDKIIAIYETRRNTGKRVTDEERAKITALWSEGVSKHRISVIMGRPRTTVREVLKMAGINNLREVN